MPETPEIVDAIAAFVAESEPFVVTTDPPLDLRDLVREYQMLPVINEMGGCYGIRPDREVVSFAWDEPQAIRIEIDTRIRNYAFHEASRKFPSLAFLAPRRSPEAIDCPHCGGTGRLLGLPATMAANIRCYCGGLGWLPAGDRG